MNNSPDAKAAVAREFSGGSEATQEQLLDYSLRKRADDLYNDRELEGILPDPFALNKMYDMLDEPSSAVFNLKGEAKRKAFDKLIRYLSQTKALTEMYMPPIFYEDIDDVFESLTDEEMDEYNARWNNDYQIMHELSARYNLVPQEVSPADESY